MHYALSSIATINDNYSCNVIEHIYWNDSNTSYNDAIINIIYIIFSCIKYKILITSI